MTLRFEVIDQSGTDGQTTLSYATPLEITDEPNKNRLPTKLKHEMQRSTDAINLAFVQSSEFRCVKRLLQTMLKYL